MRAIPLPRATLLALLAWAATCGQTIAGDDPYGQALDQGAKQFKDLTDNVKEAEGYVRQAREAMTVAYDKVKNSKMDDAQKTAALAKIREVSGSLQKFGRPLKRFTDTVAPVTKAQEVWQDLNELKEKVEKDRASQGALAGDMRVIAKVMSDLGGKVPIIGDFIETYGKLTDGMLDATGKIAGKLAEERNQGMVGGSGIYDSGDSREKNEALKEKFPELSDNVTFEPSQPPWVYIPIGQEKKPQLVWDGKDWEKVPDDADASAIFRMSLRAGRRADPAALLILCKHWDKQQTRQEAAGEILGVVDSLRKSMNGDVQTAFSGAYYHDNPLFEVLEDSVDDPDAFRFRYMYNPDSFSEMNSLLGRLYKGLSDGKADPKMVAKMEVLAKKYGIQEVLDRVHEQPVISADLACVCFRVALDGPAQFDDSGHSDASENTHEVKTEAVDFDVQDEEMSNGEFFALHGLDFDREVKREEWGGTAHYRVHGTFSRDMGMLQSLTVTYDLDPIVDDGNTIKATRNRKWSVTIANVPRDPNGGNDDYSYEAVNEYPKGCSVTQSNLEYTDVSRIYEHLHAEDENPTLTETLVRTVSGWDASKDTKPWIMIRFEPRKGR